MRILVTGGTSFIGAPLVRRLLAEGHSVKALVREGGRFDRLEGTECRLAAGDVRDEHAVSRAVFGCDSVIHLAYAPATAKPREIMDTAVNGMANVLRGCELHGVRDLMLVSSPRSGNGTYYGTGKMAAEMMMASRADHFDRTLTARVYNAYGPDMGTYHVVPQFINRLLEMQSDEIHFPIEGSGRDRRSFIFIDDCTDQLAYLYRKGWSGQRDVGTPDADITTADLAARIGWHFGREIQVDPKFPDAAPTIQLPWMCSALARHPKYDLDHGLAGTIEWYHKKYQEEHA